MRVALGAMWLLATATDGAVVTLATATPLIPNADAATITATILRTTILRSLHMAMLKAGYKLHCSSVC